MSVRVGVSSCLLGNAVRYDGGHKKDDLIAGLWAEHVQFVPVCPELELGLGVPRPRIHLTRRDGGTRLVVAESERDITDDMTGYAESRCDALGKDDLSGFIFKKDSPSCGVWRVKVHGGKMPVKEGRGLFAEVFVRRFPLVPVEEEGRLADAALRENFLVRVFAHRRLKDFFSARWTPGTLSAFHAREKLLLMAHSPSAYAALGRRVAEAKGRTPGLFAEAYMADVMKALSRPAAPKSHVNVLQHMAGYFKKLLTADEKAELHGAIQDYARALAPWLVPVTLLRHHARRFKTDYLLSQTYLSPHPKEMLLRAHA